MALMALPKGTGYVSNVGVKMCEDDILATDVPARAKMMANFIVVVVYLKWYSKMVKMC